MALLEVAAAHCQEYRDDCRAMKMHADTASMARVNIDQKVSRCKGIAVSNCSSMSMELQLLRFGPCLYLRKPARSALEDARAKRALSSSTYIYIHFLGWGKVEIIKSVITSKLLLS